MIPHAEMLVRILVGGILGGVIGWERHRHGRPVGLRTHLIVALAAATFMIVSAQFMYFQRYAAGDLVGVDPSRIAASVVSGIGFLAGGAILRTGLTVQGLTTAAGLWLVTAVGLASGAGMFMVSGAVTVMGFGALTILRRLEDKDDLGVRRHVSLVGDSETSITEISAAIAELGGVMSNIALDKRLDDKPRISLVFDVRLARTVSVSDLVRCLEERAHVLRIRVEQSTG
jgi:putative Mg2+ transporter-C (MgtC) family protein